MNETPDKPALDAEAEERAENDLEDARAFAAAHSIAGNHITEALRDTLNKLLAVQTKKETVSPQIADRLREWIANVRIENLAEWLSKDGWRKVNGEELCKRVLAAEKDRRIEECPTGRLTPYLINDTMLNLAAGMAWHAWIILELSLFSDSPRNWLAELARPWIKERAEMEAERARALPLIIQPRNIIKAQSTGAAFLRFPSLLKDAGAWCGALVPVDGNTIFAEEPDLAAAPVRVIKDAGGDIVQLYKPRAWTVAAEHLLAGPHQMTLPGMNLDLQHSPDLGAFLAVSATGAAALDLSGLCAKLAPLLFALCPLDGTPVKGPVQDLVKLLYPDWKTRRQMAGDVGRVGQAAAALRALRVVELLPTGALRVYPVLSGGYYDIPTGPDQTPEACFTMNPELAALSKPAKGQGDFMLVNLSRLMDLDARRPEHIAVALRLSAYWHTCKQRTAAGCRVFLPERLDFLPVDDLLITSNAVSLRVAEVIAGADRGQMGSRKLSEARARMVDETLPALVDKGLVGKVDARRGVKKGGGAWLVKAEPPKDYLEASAKTGRTRRKPPRNRGG